MAEARNKRVAWIEDSSVGVKLPVHFDSKTQVFHTTYADKNYQSERLRDLETSVRAAIKASIQVTWAGIIEIRPPATSRSHSIGSDQQTLGFALDRKYLTHIPDVGYKVVHWSCPAESRLQAARSFGWDEERHGTFSLPTSHQQSYYQTIIYHAYSDSLWEHLQLLQKQIEWVQQDLTTSLLHETKIIYLTTLFPQFLRTTRQEVVEQTER